MSEHFLIIDKEKVNPCDHLQLFIESQIIDANGKRELIPLDPETKVIDLINNIYIPLHPDWGTGEKQQQAVFCYGKHLKR